MFYALRKGHITSHRDFLFWFSVEISVRGDVYIIFDTEASLCPAWLKLRLSFHSLRPPCRSIPIVLLFILDQETAGGPIRSIHSEVHYLRQAGTVRQRDIATMNIAIRLGL